MSAGVATCPRRPLHQPPVDSSVLGGAPFWPPPPQYINLLFSLNLTYYNSAIPEVLCELLPNIGEIDDMTQQLSRIIRFNADVALRATSVAKNAGCMEVGGSN